MQAHKNQKLLELDALRGIMAFWVFVSHVVLFSGLTTGKLSFLGRGEIPVTVFIVLSGFAIASSLAASDATYSQYLARRAVRIYPVAMIGIVLGVLTWTYFVPFARGIGWLDPSWVAIYDTRTASISANLWQHVLAHLFLLHGAIPEELLSGAPTSLNGPMWSLSLEWQFYLVAPLLVAALSAPKERWLALAAAILVMSIFAFRYRWHFPSQPSFLPFMLGWFFLGMLTAIYYRRIIQSSADVLAASVAIVGVAICSSTIDILVPVVIWAVSVSCISVRGIPPLDLVGGLLRTRWLIWFGERSYAFYVFHFPVMTVWAYWLQKNGFMQSKIACAALLFCSLPVVVTAAWLSYKYMEKPLNSWAKDRFSGKRRPDIAVSKIEYPA
ncbi:acyltransferase [Mesorhizobium sp. INR15]|uniref:acyltransferase family protein n=1 Tax=Mesorhizobium sp. INR15 TaxID=2654248 RepID=UPI0018964E49|nr:acyltransferase [Mesorhizobium sp. INR15]QPC93080.1 acyltransferase family protein [Mesorhizobium sp. INR15]